MVLFLGSTRRFTSDVPDTMVYGPFYIPALLGRGARCMGHDFVRRYMYMSIIQVTTWNFKKANTRADWFTTVFLLLN